MSNRDLKCEERIDNNLKGRLEDLETLFHSYNNGEEYHEELGNFNEYGLSFDYVESNTFDDQKEGYYRYQLSYGGPSDEFRIWVNYDTDILKIEYWFLDWFDGASRDVTDNELIREIIEFFKEIEMMEDHKKDNETY